MSLDWRWLSRAAILAAAIPFLNGFQRDSRLDTQALLDRVAGVDLSVYRQE
ncbi:MAG: hypothetical protein LC114_26760 [Bryobacterales bacterium]|nr:hypothetical protein [Bryobacterales bacterium]